MISSAQRLRGDIRPVVVEVLKALEVLSAFIRIVSPGIVLQEI